MKLSKILKIKSQRQINKKVKQLKARLKRKQIKEDFGQDEIEKLESFIGSVDGYPYDERMKNLATAEDFDDWIHEFMSNNYLK